MKKSLLVFFLSLAFATAWCQQAGRVKITLVGAQCFRETLDDMLQLDGKGDEIFFHFDFILAAPNGAVKLQYDKRTSVYGDNTSPNFSNRINAGSAVDLFGNKRGGIKANDNFSCNEILGEYDMDADDVISIVPTIWEWDGGPDIVTNFAASLNSIRGAIADKAVQTANSISPVAGDFSRYILNAGSMVLPTFTEVFSDVFGKAGDRPIGMALNGSFGPKTIVLKTSFIKTIVNSNVGNGLGVIAVNYNEEALGNNRDHGNYTFFIKIDFTPKPGIVATTSTPPPPPIIIGTVNNKPPAPPGNVVVVLSPPVVIPENKIKRMAPTKNLATTGYPSAIKDKNLNSRVKLPELLVGKWIGTSGTASNSGPDYYAINIMADGGFQQLNQNGEIIGTGTCSLDNNQFTAVYDNSWTKNINTAGTLAGNQLSGSWGINGNSSGSGRWIVIKK